MKSGAEPFERTVAIVNGILEPMARILKENPTFPYEDYTHLLVAAIDHDVAHYQDIAAAMEDGNRRVAMYEFGLVPQLFRALEARPVTSRHGL